MDPIIFPYGSWKSPISAELVAAGEIGLEQIRLDGDDTYWIERRSQEGGRKVIVRRSAVVAKLVRTARARPFLSLLRQKILKEPGV